MSTTTKITLDNSLYAHSQQLIDIFNELIVKHEEDLLRFVPGTQINSYIDFYSNVFSYWVQLIDTDEFRVPKVEKLLFHTFAYEMNTYLAENTDTIKFLSKQRTNDEIFVYCYFFSYNFLNYMHEHMPQDLLDRFMADKNTITLYATKDSDFQNQLLKDIYAYRKDLLTDIRTNMQIRYDIQKIIHEAMLNVDKFFTFKSMA